MDPDLIHSSLGLFDQPSLDVELVDNPSDLLGRDWLDSLALSVSPWDSEPNTTINSWATMPFTVLEVLSANIDMRLTFGSSRFTTQDMESCTKRT